MSDNKERKEAGFSWQIGLLIVFYLVILVLPFLNDQSLSIYLFQNEDSIFWGSNFRNLIGSYFLTCFTLFSILPALAILFKFILKKRGYPFIASLQSFLVFIASFIFMIYALFSITIQRDIYRLDWGFYSCQIIFLIYIFNDLRFLRARIKSKTVD
ncbi:hypothetical protein D8796_02770 [Streptococcus cristatus]|uniref:DUF4293 family protein n=1 Tax=Streptococcus cristatus TaxID=45634 RepID=A0A428GVN0_STRCR|nr:hypothetical protein [Streptococcus cristatus]RSJ81580.1 hypothetical protein D8796_02770 [Streptococcus cristatus]RSJ81975.1 hypothetical protein D8795_01800 [Streptococcus cristatus]RSJ87040.1 hypothetical protein D8793_04200 [Streptococcus cristatus]RSJ87104.1 hypothetical protein D8794_02490 [Streptococcus cristatus]